MKIVYYLSILLISGTIYAQSICNSENYYPLKIGNYWEYWADNLAGPIKLTHKIVGDTVMPNGKSYYTIKVQYYDGYEYDNLYYREGENNIYMYTKDTISCPNREDIYYNFSTPDSVIWPICRSAQWFGFRGCAATFDRYYPIFNKYIESKRFEYVAIANGDTVWNPMGPSDLIVVAKNIGMTTLLAYGTGFFELKGAILNGITFGEITDLITEKNPKTDKSLNFQIAPNPLNSAAKITFTIPYSSVITLKLYDILGREIKEIVNRQYSVGDHQILFNSGQLPSGLYILILKTEKEYVSRKIVLLK